jgi:hypothetical protein
VDELRTDVSRLELSIGAAKAEYDKIKAANVAETARFAAERRAEYSAMLENFTATQVWQWGSMTTMLTLVPSRHCILIPGRTATWVLLSPAPLRHIWAGCRSVVSTVQHGLLLMVLAQRF